MSGVKPQSVEQQVQSGAELLGVVVALELVDHVVEEGELDLIQVSPLLPPGRGRPFPHS